MGTVKVLEAARACPNLKSIVSVTTDKCYENKEWIWGYREDEPMGGYDPYSSSKGSAELVISAYRRSFLPEQGVGLASVRAGCLKLDVSKAKSKLALLKISMGNSILSWQLMLHLSI